MSEELYPKQIDIMMMHFQKTHSKIISNQKLLNKKYGSNTKDFQIISELGRGSFGVVYKVYSLLGEYLLSLRLHFR